MGTDFLGNSLNNFRVHKASLDEVVSTGVTYNYYCYVHRSGQIVIMRGETDETEYKYYNGMFNDVDAVWALRQTFVYVDWNEL